MAEYVCEWCGKKFDANKFYRKFCSDECRRLATAKRKRDYAKLSYQDRKLPVVDGKYQRECLNCGKVFFAEDYRARCCSEECSRERYRFMKGLNRSAEEPKPKPKKNTLVEVAVEAKKNHTSYGKQMARRERGG